MKRTLKTALAIGALVIGLLAVAHADDRAGLEIPFSDPSRRMRIQIDIDGDEGVLIRGYEGKTVIVEPKAGKPAKTLAELGASARERDNVIALRLTPPNGLSIRVPRNASLQINATQQGNVEVEQVDGEIEATGQNGTITITGGAGPLIATSQDGRITARFASLPAKKMIFLRNLDGTIELRLPSDAKASVTLDSHDGRVQSDFPLADAPTAKGSEQRRVGKLNGGGAEIHLSTHAGTVNLLADKSLGTNAPDSTPADPKSR